MKHNVLIMGPTGTGKTDVMRTIVPHVSRLFITVTEPGLQHTLFKKSRPSFDTSKVHYRYIASAKPSWDVLRDNANKINSMTVEALQSMKIGMNKLEYHQFIDLIDHCANFKCDCHGEQFGPVDEFAESDCFAIDNASGISDMSMDLTVGAKPAKTSPDWGVAMDNLERYVKKCIKDTRCSFLLISHIDRTKDEVKGGTQITMKTLGEKLAPKLTPEFDEVILARRDGTDFFWDTAETSADLKVRVLPISNKLPPDFGQIFNPR